MNPSTASPRASAPDFFSAQVTEAHRFFLDLAPAPRGPLAVVCGGCEHCTGDYVIRRPSFSYHGIEFVSSGRGRVRFGSRWEALQPGAVFCYGPGVRHAIESDAVRPLVKYFVDFAGRDCPALLGACGLTPGKLARVHAVAEVQAVFDDLVRDGLRGTGHAAQLCATLLRYLALKIAESQGPPRESPSESYQTYLRTRTFIQERFHKLHTIEEVGAACHLHVGYCCRLFRRYARQTPYQFLLRLKMNHAADLLLQTGLMVKAVGGRVGFHDPYHFSRAFKGVFGVAPDAFRRR